MYGWLAGRMHAWGFGGRRRARYLSTVDLTAPRASGFARACTQQLLHHEIVYILSSTVQAAWREGCAQFSAPAYPQLVFRSAFPHPRPPVSPMCHGHAPIPMHACRGPPHGTANSKTCTHFTVNLCVHPWVPWIFCAFSAFHGFSVLVLWRFQRRGYRTSTLRDSQRVQVWARIVSLCDLSAFGGRWW